MHGQQVPQFSPIDGAIKLILSILQAKMASIEALELVGKIVFNSFEELKSIFDAKISFLRLLSKCDVIHVLEQKQ